MAWVAALFVGLLAWVLGRDVRHRQTALVSLHAHRDHQPVAYWAIIGFWLACLLFCAALVFLANLPVSTCVAEEECLIVVMAPQQ